MPSGGGGSVAISRLDDSLESICSTCEMLIHETSHLYFHLLSTLGKLASDTEQYFSPFPQAMRSLEPILLGAHAFTNVLAFYRDLPSVYPKLDNWCRGQLRIIVQDIDGVRPLLRRREETDARWTSGSSRNSWRCLRRFRKPVIRIDNGAMRR